MIRRLCLGVVLVVLLAPWLAFAASPADVTSLVLDPFAPNTLYASTPERGGVQEHGRRRDTLAYPEIARIGHRYPTETLQPLGDYSRLLPCGPMRT